MSIKLIRKKGNQKKLGIAFFIGIILFVVILVSSLEEIDIENQESINSEEKLNTQGQTEEKAKIKAEEDAKKEAEEEAKIKAEEEEAQRKAENSSNWDAYKYEIKILANLGSWVRQMEKLSEIVDNPYRIQNELGPLLSKMNDTISSARKIIPPENCKESHDMYLKAMDKNELVVKNLPLVINNNDANLMSELSGYVDEATEYIDQATDLRP